MISITVKAAAAAAAQRMNRENINLIQFCVG
jgi:hypothetical protein